MKVCSAFHFWNFSKNVRNEWVRRKKETIQLLCIDWSWGNVLWHLKWSKRYDSHLHTASPRSRASLPARSDFTLLPHLSICGPYRYSNNCQCKCFSALLTEFLLTGLNVSWSSQITYIPPFPLTVSPLCQVCVGINYLEIVLGTWRSSWRHTVFRPHKSYSYLHNITSL